MRGHPRPIWPARAGCDRAESESGTFRHLRRKCRDRGVADVSGSENSHQTPCRDPLLPGGNACPSPPLVETAKDSTPTVQGQRRSRDQGLKRAQIDVHPPRSMIRMRLEYLFKDEVIVCRKARRCRPRGHRQSSVPRATGRPLDGSHAIDGVTTINVLDGQDIDALCQQIDGEPRDPGIVMPDHVVHITNAGCCPATEPVPAQTSRTPVRPTRTLQPADVWSSTRDGEQDVEHDHAWLKGITGGGGGPGRQDRPLHAGTGRSCAGVLRAIAPNVGHQGPCV